MEGFTEAYWLAKYKEYALFLFLRFSLWEFFNMMEDRDDDEKYITKRCLQFYVQSLSI